MMVVGIGSLGHARERCEGLMLAVVRHMCKGGIAPKAHPLPSFAQSKGSGAALLLSISAGGCTSGYHCCYPAKGHFPRPLPPACAAGWHGHEYSSVSASQGLSELVLGSCSTRKL